MSARSLIEALGAEAQVLQPGQQRYTPVLDKIGDASLVLLGEATHGTQEFYRTRAEITKRLIVEKGFDAIAVEADWPDALRVSLYIRGAGSDNASDALRDFRRFPQWMWRNTEIVELIGWLRAHNMQRNDATKVSFFGLDLYSLHSSMEAVVRYLDQADPEAARRARARYACFDHVADDPQHYGYAATFGLKKDCQEEVIRQLIDLRSHTALIAKEGNQDALDEAFYAKQNARVVQNAEAYYRTMFLGRDESWNLRDEHMADTLDELRTHIEAGKGSPANIVVWAHNSHIGDARATEMGDHGQLNLGQLVRERHPAAQTFLLGFTTHSGTVTAASEWDGPAERKAVLPSRPDSFERVFHDTGLGNFFLPLRGGRSAAGQLRERRLERAIGVIYLPESERLSHYFHASIANQFDAVIHIDETRALRALDTEAEKHQEEMPETYPSGM